MKEGEHILNPAFDPELLSKWESNYQKALEGQYIETEETLFNESRGSNEYSLISFFPIITGFDEITGVACYAKNITELKYQQEKTLRTKEELEKIMASSLDVICTLDSNGNFVKVSAASESIWGYKAPELSGKPISAYIPSEYRERTERVFDEIRSGHTVSHFENYFTGKSGKSIPTIWSVNWDEQEGLFYCVARDATDRKEAEHLLEMNEKRFRALVENSGDSVAILDTAGNPLYVSPSISSILGYSVQEAEKLNLFDLVHPDNHPDLIADIEKVMARPGVPIKGITSRVLHKNGSWRWMEATITNLLDDPAVNGIVDNFRDVTSRVHAEEALRKSEAKLKVMLDEGSDYILILDKEGNYKYISPNFSRGMGYTFEEIIGKPAFDFIHPEDLQIVQEKFSESKSKSRVITLPYRFRHKDGHWMWFQTVGTKLLSDGLVYGILCNSADITSIIETQEKLKESEARYRAFYESQTNFVRRTDLRGNFSYVNKKFRTEFGKIFTRENLIGLNFIKSLESAEKKKVRKIWKQCINEPGKVLNADLNLYRETGKMISTLWDVICITDSKGQPNEIQMTGIDVSEKLKYQELYKKACELSRVGGWELNLRTNEVSLSEISAEIVELTGSGQIDFQKALSFFRIDDRDYISNCINKAVKEGTPWDLELPGITNNGNEKWVRVIGSAEFKDGKCFRLYGSLQDIHRIKEVELRLQNTADNIPGALFQYIIYPDGKDKIQFLTKGAIDLWGYSAEECMEDINIIWNQTKEGGDYTLVQNSISESAKSMNQWNIKYRSRLPDGRILWHHGIGTPKKLPDGSIIWDSLIIDVTEQKEIESLLETASELAKIGSWEISPHEGMVYLSPMSFRIFGLSESLIPSIEDWRNCFKEGWSRNAISEAVSNPIDLGNSWDLELIVSLPSGQEVWVRCIGEVELDSEGEAIKIFGSLQEINSRKLAQLELEIFKKIIDNSQDGIAIADREKGPVFLNPAFLKQLDYSFEEFEELGDPSFVYADKAQAKEVFDSLFAGDYWSGDVDLINRKGQIINYYLSGGPILNEQGEVSSIFGIHTDISDRKKSAIELEKALDEKSTILERIGDAFIALDENWRVLYWNKQAEKILGIKRDEILGNELWEKFPQAKELDFFQQYSRAMEEQVQVHFEEYLPRLDQWYEVFGYPSPEGISIFFRDVTEKKKSEESIKYKTKQLNVVAEVNSKLLNLEDWYSAIENSFSRIADAVNADRIYYFKNFADHTTGEKYTSQKMEWCREGIQPRINHPGLSKIKFDSLPNLMKTLGSGQVFTAMQSEIYNESEIEFLKTQTIKSILILPITVHRQFWGWIGFDDCTKQRNWTEDEISFLRTITGNLSSAIEKYESGKKLQEAYSEMNSILQSISDCFFALDQNMNFTFINPPARSLLKIRKDFSGNIFDYRPELKNTKLFSALTDHESSGKPSRFEFFYTDVEKWYDANIYPKPDGYAVFLKDITIQKDAVEQIRQSNERFEKVAQATNDAIWDWDISKDTLFWGSGFAATFGYEAEIMDTNIEFWRDHIHPEDIDDVIDTIDNLLESPVNNYYSEEYRFKKKDGNYAYVLDKGIVIRNEEGEAVRMVGAMSDIKYRREHEDSLKALNASLESHAKELENSNAELEQFAYIASHDLQEPLRMITGFLTLLERKFSDKVDDKAMQYMRFATDGAKRMKQIILDLLDYSRAGKFDEQSEKVDLNQIVEEYKILRRRMITEKKVKIITRLNKTVNAYKTPLTQVFHCLIDNAIKYSKSDTPPEVTVLATESPREWVISVEDNGIGIEREFYKKYLLSFSACTTEKITAAPDLGWR